MKQPNLESFSDKLPLLRSERNKRTVEIQRLKTECIDLRVKLQSGNAPNPGNAEEVRLRKLMGKEPIQLVLPDRERLAALLITLNNLNADVSTFDAEILKETQLANKKLIASEMDTIKRNGSECAKALLYLCAACLHQDEHLDSLESVGADVGQYRIRLSGLGSPRDLSSGFAFGMREFIDSGFMSKSDLPKAFR
jgi:hypothetical protein